MNRFYKSGGSHPQENEGGDRKPKNMRQEDCQCNGFNGSKRERMYLPAELNIRKLWRMYNAESDNDLKVKQGYATYLICVTILVSVPPELSSVLHALLCRHKLKL